MSEVVLNDYQEEAVAHLLKQVKEQQSIVDNTAVTDAQKEILLNANRLSVLVAPTGSGTTGQAVAELNPEDGGTQQVILVTDAGKEGGGHC
jgi:inosine-uridine nucleoside N-ribohydrolase